MIQIRKYKNEDIEALKETFRLTSGPNNPSVDRWLTVYLENYPTYAYVATDEDQKIIGYLTGCADTRACRAHLGHLKSLYVFENHLEKYPAHLHINCHPEFQGRGAGTKLVEMFLSDMKEQGVPGVFVVTDPNADNVKFYSKLGFDSIEEKDLNGSQVVLLGRRL